MFDQIPVEMFDRIDRHPPAGHGEGDTCRVAASAGAGWADRQHDVELLFGITGTTHYITAKGGVLGLTKSLAMDGRSAGIKVNAIMPCAYTRMTANIPDEAFRGFLEKHFTADKVAPFVVWLASAGVPVSGKVFSVGGGRAAAGRAAGVAGDAVGATPGGGRGAGRRADGHGGGGVPAGTPRAEACGWRARGLGLGEGLDGAWEQ
ncbi:SDR family oxidoreductase [Yinghuangia aomiensis]